ncbi:wax ester/triacylglycerol synthase family O-acyltransferase [uncultured Piscinibacter sp.]|uniref:wax ester/triacylglycerol synthase family O-acyltransferase n=1 Tax=uncultured Piscinibacter sp. TaxID=1131835 RepID=UPI0026036FA3|nr:wax ester/triacylglycerol synthase family O-acyltransferase [uncultured Piscinibacter sp.]
MKTAAPRTAEPMSRVDTAWRRMDSDVNLMMIVGVWLYRPAIGREALCERIADRLLRYERFMQRAELDTFGARWVHDPAFDLMRHVVVEPLPARRRLGERRALQRRMGELASTPLDAAHPLWQFHLVEDFEGGCAIICRIHHCIGDGVALNAVLMTLADGAAPLQPPRQPRRRAPGRGDALLQPLTELAAFAGTAAARSLHWIEQPGQAFAVAQRLARDGVQLIDDVAALALLPDDSPTRFKGHGSGRKVVAWCDPLPLDPVKAVGKALGASVNDVLITCVAGAIGHALRAAGDDTTGCDLRAMVPVNLRPPQDAWQLGNRFGLVPLLVPVGITNPIERLGVVHARMQALKGSYQPLLSYALLGLAGWLVEPGERALNKLFLDKTTAVMTNVVGPPQRLRLCGSTLRQSIFWVPASGDVGMGVSIISYAGGVQFGLITDERLCPHPQRIIDRFGKEFELLLLLCLMLPWDGLEPPAQPAAT